jgi:hypothetical protein
MKKICILALTAIGALLLIEAPSWGKEVSSCGSNSRHPVTRCHVAHRSLGVETTDASRQTKRHPNLLSVPVPPPANRSPDILVAKGSLRQLKDFDQEQSRDSSGDSGDALSACLTCPNLVQSFPELILAADQKPRTARLVESSARVANAAGEQKPRTARLVESSARVANAAGEQKPRTARLVESSARIANAAGEQKPPMASLVDSSARRAKAAGRRRQMGYYNNVYGMTVGANIYEQLSAIYSPGFGNSRFYYGTDPDPRIVFELHRDPSWVRASASR